MAINGLSVIVEAPGGTSESSAEECLALSVVAIRDDISVQLRRHKGALSGCPVVHLGANYGRSRPSRTSTLPLDSVEALKTFKAGQGTQ
jgi:hypothetical protein